MSSITYTDGIVNEIIDEVFPEYDNLSKQGTNYFKDQQVQQYPLGTGLH